MNLLSHVNSTLLCLKHLPPLSFHHFGFFLSFPLRLGSASIIISFWLDRRGSAFIICSQYTLIITQSMIDCFTACHDNARKHRIPSQICTILQINKLKKNGIYLEKVKKVTTLSSMFQKRVLIPHIKVGIRQFFFSLSLLAFFNLYFLISLGQGWKWGCGVGDVQ